ncbi:MotE family protein [Roseobacter ponti]|nr:hypothetical protein [Roseobacter ponti]
MMISFLFLASAGIRLGTGAGQAVATESPDQALASVQEPATGALSSGERERLSGLLEAFREREERLVKREQQMDIRQKALSVADEEVQRRLVVLEEAEKSLRSLLAIANTAAEDDLARLTAVYESMKPKDAAALFEKMEPAFAAGFLGRMRSDAAAGVMAGLTPETAYSISVILAGRNADVPKG